MKKTIKLVAVVMVVAMLALALVSCAKTLNGTYSNTSEDFLGLTTTTVVYTFEKDTFEKKITTSIGGTDVTTTETGTYEITEDETGALVIVFTTVDGDTTVTSSYSFVEGKEGDVKYIKIGDTQYNYTK